MDNWMLVADSSCDLAPEDLNNDVCSFSTVPLKILVGEEEFVDAPGTDVNRMLSSMREYKGAPSSACPSPESFAQEFRKAARTIAVTITSGLSGTYNSAVQGMRMVLEEEPERSIHVVDSRSTSGSMILILRRLKELISQGLPFDEIVERIEHYRNDIHILFSLASFDNLVKTGRMSYVAGIFASALNIRAVATNSVQGTIQVLEKPRGEKRAIERMAALMSTFKDMTGKPVVITHCNNPDGAREMERVIREHYDVSDVTILPNRCLTAFYAGDQGLLLSF